MIVNTNWRLISFLCMLFALDDKQSDRSDKFIDSLELPSYYSRDANF